MLEDVSSRISHNLPVFNNKSAGYKMLCFAAAGEVAKLSELIQTDSSEGSLNAGRLQCCQREPPAYFTPLHYAIAKTQWVAAAFLLSQGVSWEISSITSKGVGQTAIDKLNSIPNGLSELLRALVTSPSPINVEALAKLLTSSRLSTSQKLTVLNDYQLRKDLSKRVQPDEALFLMASLLTGSQKWAGNSQYYTFYDEKYDEKDIYNINDSLCCNELLCYSSFLTGLHTKLEILDYQEVGRERVSAEIREKINSCTNNDIKMQLLMPYNEQAAKSFGLSVRDESSILKLDSKVEKFTVKVFYSAYKTGFVHHYGLIAFSPSNPPVVVHITERKKPQGVICEQASIAPELDTKFYTIYTSMLPWHLEK